MKMQPGTYNGQMTELYMSQSSTNKPFLAIEFNVTHIAQNGQWAELGTPETRTVRFFLTPAAIDYSEDKLASLGFNGDYANPKCSKVENVTLTCEDRQYKDKEGNLKTAEDWNIYTQRQSAERVDVPSDTIRQLNARWRSKHGAPAPAAAPPAPTAPAPAAQASAASPDVGSYTTDDDSDIPF